MSASIWVKLYIKGKDNNDQQAVEIESTSLRNVNALKKAVQVECKLDYCGVQELFVYKAGTEFPTEEETPLGSGKSVCGEANTYETPLRVVAPVQQQQQQPARNKIYCRTWSTEGNHGTYKLPVDSYDDLKQQASQKFNLAADKLSLYFIPDGKNIDSRKTIKEDSDLEDFMQLGGNPVVLAWEKGSDGSPKELPGEITQPFSASVVSSLSTSTRGHIQKIFQTGVLTRDNQHCIVSGMRYKQGSGNVEAAHIIPVAEGKDSARQAAEKASGLFSLYDIGNGMCLEKGLHTAFDSYLWCVDEKGIIHLSDAETDNAKIEQYGLAKWAGNTLNLNIGGELGYPSEKVLKARHDLFLAKVEEKKQKGNTKTKASVKKKS